MRGILLRQCILYFCYSNSNYDCDQHENIQDKSDDKWKSVIETTLFPAMKKMLKPPKACEDNLTFNCVADLPDLYKVFERC